MRRGNRGDRGEIRGSNQEVRVFGGRGLERGGFGAKEEIEVDEEELEGDDSGGTEVGGDDKGEDDFL